MALSMRFEVLIRGGLSLEDLIRVIRLGVIVAVVYFFMERRRLNRVEDSQETSSQ